VSDAETITLAWLHARERSLRKKPPAAVAQGRCLAEGSLRSMWPTCCNRRASRGAQVQGPRVVATRDIKIEDVAFRDRLRPGKDLATFLV
jgi:hypothetical protein